MSLKQPPSLTVKTTADDWYQQEPSMEAQSLKNILSFSCSDSRI